MAVLAVGAVGAAIGGAAVATATAWTLSAAVLTGISVGWAVGSAVGSYFFGPKPPDAQDTFTEGPRLNSLVMRGGSYAADIPDVRGTARLGATVIWKTPLEEVAVTTQSVIEGPDGGKGGKGGGGGSAISTSVSYEYYGTFAVLVCEGPVSIGRIWLNSVLAYGGSGESLIGNFITIYEGTREQEVDPTMEAVEGVGNVPAYRGCCYIVFDRLPLEDFGYSIPNVEVEVNKLPVNFCGTQLLGNERVLPPEPSDWSYQWAVQERGEDPDKAHLLRSTITRVQIGTSSNYEYHPGFDITDTDRNIIQKQVCKEFYVGSWSSSFASVLFEGAEVSMLGGALYTVPNDFFSIDTPITLPVEDQPGVEYRGKLVWKAQIPNLEITDGFVYHTGRSDTAPDGVRIHVVQFLRDLDGNVIDLLPIKIFKFNPGDVPAGAWLAHVYRDVFDRWWVAWAASILESTFQAQRISFDLDNDLVVVENTFTVNSNENLGNWEDLFFGTNCVFYQDKAWQLYSADLNFDDDTTSNQRKLADNTDIIYHIYSTGRYVLTGQVSGTLQIQSGSFVGDVGGEILVGDVINDFCLMSGLRQDQVDTTAITDTMIGYIRPSTMSVRSVIAPLMSAFMIHAVESGGKLIFKSSIDESTQTGVTVLEDDMGAHAFGAGGGDNVLALRRVQEMEMPKEVRVIYSDPLIDYDVNVHKAVNPVSISQSRMDFEAPMVLTATAAKTIAFNYLNGSQTDRLAVSFALLPNHMAFEPGDILKLETHRGTLQVRLGRASLSPLGILECEGVLFEGQSYLNSPTADELPGPAQLPNILDSEVILLDIPLLRAEDAPVSGIYAAGSHKWVSDIPWPGASLYHQLGGGWNLGTYWSEGKEATHGTVAEPVLDVAQPWNWDDASELVVTTDIPLTSSTDEDVQAGANQAAIGVHGRWEIVGFVNVEDLGSDQYKLTRLLRARRGTEQHTGTNVSGDTFVLLDTVGIRRSALPTAMTETSVNWRMVSANDRIARTEDTPFTSENVGDTPLAPVNITGARDTAEDLAISWTRRSRCAVDGEMGETYDVCEVTEEYHVELRLVADGPLLRTVVIGEATQAIYTLGMYRADIGDQSATEIPTLVVTIYQISGVVGRGYPGEAFV